MRKWTPSAVEIAARAAHCSSGVADDGSVHGLASDRASLGKLGKDDRDRFQLHLNLNQPLINALSEAAASSFRCRCTRSTATTSAGSTCSRAPFPVAAKVVVDKGGQLQKKTASYVRIGHGTREVRDEGERQKYIASRWGRSGQDGTATSASQRPKGVPR